MSFLLALDSSTECMAIALCDVERAAGQFFFEGGGGAQASQQMLYQVRALLSQGGLAMADLAAVAFGCGPGAFTGLRTACAVAQGLAFGLGVPVLSIDSLKLVAEDAREQALAQGAPLDGPIWVLMDARMNELYAAEYLYEDGRWRVLQPPGLYAPAALVASWSEEPQAVCGSGIEPFFAALRLNTRVRAWPRTQSRAHALGALARAAWRDGAHLDAAQAMPLYVRDKVALTTEERAR